MNTFGLNRPVYSFGLGLFKSILDELDKALRTFMATECMRRTYIATSR